MFDLPTSILSLAKSVWEHGKEVPLLNEILNAVESSALHIIHHFDLNKSKQRHIASSHDTVTSMGNTVGSVETRIKTAACTYDVTALTKTNTESAVPAIGIVSNCSPNISPRSKTNMPHKKVESVKYARLSFLTPKHGSKKSRRKSKKRGKKTKKSLSPPPPPNSEVIHRANVPQNTT